MSHWVSLVELLVKRDLKVRYRGSFLGYIWSMLNPLLMMSVLTIVFSYAMRVKIENYAGYVLSGLVVWNLFAQSLGLGVNCFVDNASLLKKVKVPAWVFPTAVIGSASIHAMLALIPYLLIAQLLGVGLSWSLIQFPLVFLLFFVFMEGLVLVLGSMNVFFRDVAHVIDPVLQVVFYATPIIYPMSLVPEKFRDILELNPILHFIDGFRASIFDGQFISGQSWAILALLSFVSVSLGALVFGKNRDKFLYYV